MSGCEECYVLVELSDIQPLGKELLVNFARLGWQIKLPGLCEEILQDNCLMGRDVV